MFFFYLSGCKTKPQSIKNRSIGAPGEVLVVLDKDMKKSEVYSLVKAFAHQEFPCIPQPEPTFKLTTIETNAFERHFKAYRNIIIIKKNIAEKPNVAYKKNVWASYQQVVEITVPDLGSFGGVFEKNQVRISDFLYNGDIKTMLIANKKGADAATQRFY